MEIPICISVANRIINRTNAQNVWRWEKGQYKVKLTGRRLQKILYLCQLFWYADHEESNMIPENFYAWGTGPVIPQIYDIFPVYQDGDMCPLKKLETYTLSAEEVDLINKIVDNTIDISTETLIDYTQLADTPWSNVFKEYGVEHGVISDDSIKQYIRKPEHQRELLDFIQKKVNYEGTTLVKKPILPRNTGNK